jgi:hypothetical protein
VSVLLAKTTSHLQQLTFSRAKPLSVPARYDAGFSSLRWPLSLALVSVKVVPDPPTASRNVLACLLLPLLCC